MGLLPDHHIQVIVIAIQTAENIPFEERPRRLEEMTRHLEKICLGQRDPLSKDGKNLGRIWQNLLNVLADDKIMTKAATRHHDVLSLLEEAAQYLKKACPEQWDLSMEGDLEQTRQNMKGLFVEDKDDSKADATRLLYDLARTFGLEETAQYLKKAYLKRREALNTASMYHNLKGCLELIRRNLKGIFMRDEGDNKVTTALLLYNGPDLAEIYSLRESAQYPEQLRRIRIGWLRPRSTYQHGLERIRQNLMKILKDNEAATCVLFYNGPDLTDLHSLVLNAASSVIAPRIEVPAPQQVPAQPEEGEE